MTLIQRKKNRPDIKSSSTPNQDAARGRGHKAKILCRVALALIHLHVFYFLFTHVRLSDPSKATWKGDGYSVEVIFAKAQDGTNYLGPHHLTVSTSASCDTPSLGMRIVGDFLLHVSLTEEEPHRWVGSFTLPMDGKYKLESNWQGCDGNGKPDITYHEFDATENDENELKEEEKEDSLSANSVWVNSEKIKIANIGEGATENRYVWSNLSSVINDKNDMTVLDGADKSIVLEESIVRDYTSFKSFEKLSNYELVCWIGSKSAEKIREAFLSLRPQKFPHQRPFKFHYYPSTSFVTPDSTWDDEAKTKFRKCKHILISLDEPNEHLSQLEYKQQVTTFIRHLLNAFDEEHTFPALIWMFTVNESPIGSKNCQSPYLTKTTNHPCNDALKDLFQNSPFPNRVQLLDNSDLSSPVQGQQMGDVFAAIALKIFLIVGKQVKSWRDAGISGGINGLTQNGVTKPNFDLVPYDWSTKLSD